LLSDEKLSATNTIDSIIADAATNINSMKKCPNCDQQHIENRKQVCLQNAMTEMQRQRIGVEISEADSTS